MLVANTIYRIFPWWRYQKETYAEFDIGDIPPGEVV